MSRPLSIGVQLSTPEEAEGIADFLNAEIPGRDDPKHFSRGLRVNLLEDDPRLQLLLKRLESKYGWKPSKWFNIPLEERSRYFGIRKTRQYSKPDLDGASFLHLDFADRLIASQIDGTDEEADKEIYVAAADRRQSTNTQFGTLMPFHGLCVTESLGRQLGSAGLTGMFLEPVVIRPADRVKKPLLKLSSSVVAPRSLLPVVNEQGHQVEPNTQWPSYFDDGGYHPHEFKYRITDLKRFQEVDIAVSYERTGVTKARAFRWCLVSQRFRQVMAELNVPGVRYAPVRFAG